MTWCQWSSPGPNANSRSVLHINPTCKLMSCSSSFVHLWFSDLIPIRCVFLLVVSFHSFLFFWQGQPSVKFSSILLFGFYRYPDLVFPPCIFLVFLASFLRSTFLQVLLFCFRSQDGGSLSSWTLSTGRNALWVGGPLSDTTGDSGGQCQIATLQENWELLCGCCHFWESAHVL